MFKPISYQVGYPPCSLCALLWLCHGKQRCHTQPNPKPKTHRFILKTYDYGILTIDCKDISCLEASTTSPVPLITGRMLNLGMISPACLGIVNTRQLKETERHASNVKQSATSRRTQCRSATAQKPLILRAKAH